jgi:hypothetical protein
MPSLIRATCLTAALAIAGPALAQEGPATKFNVAKLTTRSHAFAPGDPLVQGSYMKACGQRFLCYTGIPLNCTLQTRPYENIAEHQCFCLHDGCPQ